MVQSLDFSTNLKDTPEHKFLAPKIGHIWGNRTYGSSN